MTRHRKGHELLKETTYSLARQRKRVRNFSLRLCETITGLRQENRMIRFALEKIPLTENVQNRMEEGKSTGQGPVRRLLWESRLEIMNRGRAHGNEEMGISGEILKQQSDYILNVEAKKKEKSKITLRYLIWLPHPYLHHSLRPLSVCILNGCLYMSVLCKLLDRKGWFTPICTSECLILVSPWEGSIHVN